MNKKTTNKKILDACCGSKMFWFDKENTKVLFMDNRTVETTLCDGRKLIVNPDLTADFTNMPFGDNSFYLVVFDPPHLISAGSNSWLAKKYGVLPNDLQTTLIKGFDECLRVLKETGTLVFKWNEEQVKLSEVLKVLGCRPLFGNKRSKTHWLVFMKGSE